jgi:hypothetical protein
MDRRQREQVDGAVKQVEGKVQNAWGNAKDAEKKAVNRERDLKKEPVDDSSEDESTETAEIDVRSRRKVS